MSIPPRATNPPDTMLPIAADDDSAGGLVVGVVSLPMGVDVRTLVWTVVEVEFELGSLLAVGSELVTLGLLAVLVVVLGLLLDVDETVLV